MSEPTPSPSDPAALGTRAELVAAALRLFLARGYAETSIDAVAEAAGYTKGAVYWHFGSKEGLLVEVFSAWANEGYANLRRALRASDPDERDRAIEAWHSGDAERSRRWILFEMELLRLAQQSPELAERLRERQRAVWQLLADALAEDLADRTPSLAPRELAILLSALSDGLLQQHLVDPESVRGLFARFVDLVIPAQPAGRG